MLSLPFLRKVKIQHKNGFVQLSLENYCEFIEDFKSRFWSFLTKPQLFIEFLLWSHSEHARQLIQISTPPPQVYLLKTTTGKNHLKLKRMYAKYSIQMVLDRLHFSMMTSQKLFQLNCKCIHHIHQILHFVLYHL